MSETQQPKDLTAQLAQWVRSHWESRHTAMCILVDRRATAERTTEPCDGVGRPFCRHPKPSALVAYEQAPILAQARSDRYRARLAHDQQARRDLAERQRRGIDGEEHVQELPNPDCSCQICHDLRADGAGEQQTTDARDVQADLDAFKRWDAKPALAYVLTMQRRNDQVTLVLRDYADRARAEDSRRLLEEIADGSHITYRVHAVPRVE